MVLLQSLQVGYLEMSPAPIRGKPLDKDELFAKMVKHYVEKKNYTVERANEVAQKIVEQQIARRQTS